MCLNFLGECGDFAGRQVPPRAWRQAGELDAANFDADQLGDRVPQGRHHPAHLPVAPFVNGEFNVCLAARAVRVRLAPQQADIFRRPGHAVVEHDPAPKALQRVFRRDAGDGDAIRLWNMIPGMGQLKQKIAVVGEKDQTFAVGI